MQIFSSDKGLQEIFFPKSSTPPPPSRVKWSAPKALVMLRRSISSPGGGDSHMKVMGMLVGKLEETNLGVAPALFNP